VFDEPTSGLDYTHMMRMGRLLEQLKEEGRFLFVITHDYEFIVKCCDRVVRIEDGRVVDNFRLNEAGYQKLRAYAKSRVARLSV
jgi:energy-coupling factor transport system ATP-binding protein